jgi:hypothetical protein
MISKGLIAVGIVFAIGTASAVTLASRVSDSLARGTSTQTGTSLASERQDASPMDRYKAASREAAAVLKESLEACKALKKPARAGCAREAREQQRVSVVQANARITQEIAATRIPGQVARN